MPASYTAQEMLKAIGATYNELDYFGFVEYILGVKPRNNDVWQEEKWQIFGEACRALLRLSPEYLDKILAFSQ